MPIQPITYFEGDSWKKQPEESDRGYHYFKQYRKETLSRNNFKKLLLREADERSTKGHIKFWGSDAQYNKKHQKEIQEYIDSEGKKGKCPKPCSTIEDYFRYHKWFTRKKDYDSAQEEEADLMVQSMVTAAKVDMAQGLIDNINLTIRQRKNQKQAGQGTLSQDEAGAKSINTDLNSLNVLSNNDTQKVDVNANVEAEAILDNPGLNKIAEAYLNGRKQYEDESTS